VRRILFNWGVLANTASNHCLALGYGSLYNHGNPANMRYEGDAEAKLLRFVAIRAIAAGEELTVNYSAEGGGHESAENDWFARMGERNALTAAGGLSSSASSYATSSSTTCQMSISTDIRYAARTS